MNIGKIEVMLEISNFYGVLMNKKEQIRRLKKYLKKNGIEEDLIDLEAIVDGKLSYKENKRLIEDIVKVFKTNNFSLTRIDKIRAIVEELNDRRKRRSVNIDIRKQAKNTFLLADLLTNKKKLKKYLKHPNWFDVEGVDDLKIFDIKKNEKELEEMMKQVGDIFYDEYY